METRDRNTTLEQGVRRTPHDDPRRERRRIMNVGGAGGSPYIQGGMAGVGVRMLNTAQEAQMDMAKKMLPMQAAENAGRAASEAKGMFVDTYA